MSHTRDALAPSRRQDPGNGGGPRAAIGAVIAAEPDTSAALAVAARRLADLCDATVAIWATGERSEGPRLLAGHPLERATELDPCALATLSRAVAGREP